MTYRETILTFIQKGDQAGMMAWLKSQPDLIQLQILDELKVVMQDFSENSDPELWEDKDKMVEAVDNYENAIVNDQVASLKAEMAENDLAAAYDEADILMQNLRNSLIDGILSNPPNVAELKQIAANMIQLEKDNNLHDPENWKGLLPM